MVGRALILVHKRSAEGTELMYINKKCQLVLSH